MCLCYHFFPPPPLPERDSLSLAKLEQKVVAMLQKMAATCASEDKKSKADFLAHNHDGKAIDFYGRSADQGNAGAESMLGVCFSNGWGVKSDSIKAVRWFARAESDAQPKSKLFQQADLHSYLLINHLNTFAMVKAESMMLWDKVWPLKFRE